MTTQKHNLITKTAEAPAEMLGRAVLAGEAVRAAGASNQLVQKTKDYWHVLGPGLTTGASDDDPSGIATYSQAGASTGFSLLWLAPWTFPMMVVVQEMCARIGLVTGRGLAGNIRIFFSQRVLYICTLLLFMANTFNIGADLGAMAKATQLLYPGFDFGLLVAGFALFSLVLQIFTPYTRYAKYLKWLSLILIAYIFSALLAGLDWSTVLHSTFVPHIQFDKEQILLITAVLGTTISPYLFFWQTAQEVEKGVEKGQMTIASRQGAEASEVKDMRVDVWTGMFLSNLVMFFIVAAAGGILYPHGITHIQTAAQAAEALRPFAGNLSYFLFAVGIIGTGLLAIPVLAGSSSYALAESFHWRMGLYRNLAQAKAFYGIIIISMLVGLGINFVGIDPIKALIYAAVGNALIAPVILFFIIRISSSKKHMGQWANHKFTTFIGWVVFAVMSVAALATIATLLR